MEAPNRKQEETKPSLKIDSDFLENGWSSMLSEEERKYLESYEHTMDYKLSDEQLKFFTEEGYIVVPGLIEKELCEELATDAFKRASQIYSVKEINPSTWSKLPFHGCIDVFHPLSLYKLRQHPKLYSVFAQLLKTPKLTVSLDRLNIKAPCYDKSVTNKDLDIHHDLNLWRSDPKHPPLQGGLCLRDCPEGGGGFFCIPKWHKPSNVAKYKKRYENGDFGDSQLPKTDFCNLADKEEWSSKIEIPMKQGDFVIWNSFLPHNGGKNTLSNHWRLHAYVRMMPLEGPCATEKDIKWHEEYRDKTVRKSMETGLRPTHYSTGNIIKTKKNDPETAYSFPKLTPLGECIFGSQPWKPKDK